MISLSERPTRVPVGMFLIAAATAGVIWALIGGWVALIVAVAGFGPGSVGGAQPLGVVGGLTPGIGIPRPTACCCLRQPSPREPKGAVIPPSVTAEPLAQARPISAATISRAHADQWQAAAGVCRPADEEQTGNGAAVGRAQCGGQPAVAGHSVDAATGEAVPVAKFSGVRIRRHRILPRRSTPARPRQPAHDRRSPRTAPTSPWPADPG